MIRNVFKILFHLDLKKDVSTEGKAVIDTTTLTLLQKMFILYFHNKDMNWFSFYLIKDICRNSHENK